MNPFFFGARERQLFGVYTPPRSGARANQAVLLCYPFGSEHMRAHRAFRQLAGLLNRAGAHVLRFDYYGTGDSAGRGDEATFEDWISDIHSAVDELKDTCAVSTVSLIGLRLGGTLATLAAADRTDLDRVVLWDPIVDGARYLRDLLGIAGQAPVAAQPLGVSGFPLTHAMRTTLTRLDLRGAAPPRARWINIVAATEQPEDAELEAAWRARHASVQYHYTPSPGDWAVGDAFGSALLPQDIIQRIVSNMTQEAA